MGRNSERNGNGGAMRTILNLYLLTPTTPKIREK